MKHNDLISTLDTHLCHRTSNTIWNHLRTLIVEPDCKYNGNTTGNEFTVWPSGHPTGLFYPVIQGRLTGTNKQTQFRIRSELNPLGRIVAAMLLILITYGILSGIIIQEDNSWTFLWKRILVGLFILSIPVLTFRMIIRHYFRKEVDGFMKWCKESLEVHEIKS